MRRRMQRSGRFDSKFTAVAFGLVVAALAGFGTYELWFKARPDAGRAASHAGPSPPPPAESAPPTFAPAAAASRETADRADPEKPATEAALATIDGLVADAQARPVSGARVVLGRRTKGWLESLESFRNANRRFERADSKKDGVRIVTSSSDGTFRFDAVDARDSWAVGAIHDPLGCGWSDRIEFSGAPAQARVVVTLEAGVVIFGVVRDPTGVPVAAVRVDMEGRPDPPSDTASDFSPSLNDFSVTGEDGSYRSCSLPWRFVRIQARASTRDDLGPLETSVEELPSGVQEVRRDLTLPALTTLRGRILGPDRGPAHLMQTVVPKLGADAGRTQSRETIAVAAFAEDPRANPALIDSLCANEPGLVVVSANFGYGKLELAEDRYVIPLRNPRLRFVAVLARDRLLGAAEIPTPARAPDVVIDPSLVPERSLVHALQLHFRDGRDGTPLEGVVVHARVVAVARNGRVSTEFFNFGAPATRPPDRDLQLPRRPCWVIMEHEGFVTRSVAIDASRDDAPGELTIDFLPAGGALVLHVVDEGGSPVTGVRPRIYRASDREPVGLRRVGATDERGDCRVVGVPRGDLQIVVEMEGFAPAAARISHGDEEMPVRLVLPKGYEVTVNARTADGNAAKWGQLSIIDEAGVPLYDAFHPGAPPVLLSGSKFRLTDGTYTVRCLVPGGDGATQKFVAAPGAVIDVTLAPVR